jgi:hypothetical protein
MTGLVDAELPAAGERHLGEQTPAPVEHRTADHPLLLHGGDEVAHVVAQQVELVHVVLLARVHGHLARRQAEDQPALAHVHAGEPEHLAQESAIGVRVRAVEDGMGTDDHGAPPSRARSAASRDR